MPGMYANAYISRRHKTSLVLCSTSVLSISWSDPADTARTGRIAYFNTKGEGMALPPTQWQSNMRRGYYAAISYVDDLIGQALQTLEELGLAEDTVVSFTGDQ